MTDVSIRHNMFPVHTLCHISKHLPRAVSYLNSAALFVCPALFGSDHRRHEPSVTVKTFTLKCNEWPSDPLKSAIRYGLWIRVNPGFIIFSFKQISQTSTSMFFFSKMAFTLHSSVTSLQCLLVCVVRDLLVLTEFSTRNDRCSQSWSQL